MAFALLVVAGGLALAQKWQGATWWVVGGAAGLAAVVAGVSPLLLRSRDQRTAGAAVVRRSVHTTGRSVTELSLDDLRVHTSVVDVPYLPRPEKEREVIEHLRARRAVLIVGASMVGKTRLAAAAVEQFLPDTPLLLPDTPTALTDLDKADVILDQQVIWLDDLERFLTTGGVTAGLIHRLRESNWLVATLRAHEWDRFQPTDHLRPPEWDALRLFELVLLDRDRDQPAESDLRRAVPDEYVRERIARIGIGEYVGAAQHVRDQLTVGEFANPLGFALVAGAADWSRMGLNRFVPAELLPQLAAARLASRRRAELSDEKKFHTALEWATRNINPAVSFLELVNGTYQVHDLALEQLAATHRAIPIATWELAVDEAAEGELMSVGYQAMVLHDQHDIAERAWEKAAKMGYTGAINNLGLLSRKRGELTKAEHCYRQAATIGDTEGMNNLGALLGQRNKTEAEHWLRKAANAEHVGAMNNLGMLLRKQGESTEAKHWLSKAANAGIVEATYTLGTLLEERGETTEAEYWYSQAADLGVTDAIFNLGALLQERGKLAEAEFRLREAAVAGYFGAMFRLGVLLEERGESTEAERWYLEAAEVGDTDAMTNLGALLAKRGELTRSKYWLQAAAETGHTEAMAKLDLLLQVLNDQPEAED
ncbi:tetratricopeptide repeat protein [Amycolatopsis sp. lyj-23]|uniref:SEL1-like repeat protein n=1 Tax=Amycolatopsis sp. lyj-23 TaxID=2789283 RepID=UPI00397A7297